MHKLAEQLLKAAKECEEIHAFMTLPARDVLRVPVPTAVSTTGQLVDMLGLFLIIAPFERYAKGLKGAAAVSALP